MKLKNYIIAAIVLVFFIFIIQNASSVTVTFLFFQVTMPRALLLFITLIVGLVVGIFLPFNVKRKSK